MGFPRLLDFGSGDGRIVLEAARRGFHAEGYEINPYLWAYSLLRRRLELSALERQRCQFRLGNMWARVATHAAASSALGEQTRRSRWDVITIYGRPGDSVMERIGTFVAQERPKFVVSNKFAIPGMERNLVKDVDGLKLYQL